VTVPAAEKTPAPAEDVPSQEPVVGYVVLWPAVSVHLDGATEPVTVAKGERLPDAAAGQGPFLKSIGAVAAVARQ
jgi:hypothetical protein